LSDVLSTVPDDVFSLLPQPQQAALDAALLRSSPLRTPDRRAVGAGFLSVLRALAADGPVVLAIDDLQWLDSPTTAVVDFALRRLRAEPVRAIFTARSGTASRLLATLEREPGPTRIELPPFT